MTATVLSPATVLGSYLDVSPAYDDDLNERPLLVHAVNAGMSERDAVRFAERAAGIICGFEFELCEVCHNDLDRHHIGTGPFGEAHSFCMDSPVELPN